MKLTVSVPKLTLKIAAALLIIGGCKGIDHFSWLDIPLCVAGLGLMFLVEWATAQKRKACRASK